MKTRVGFVSNSSSSSFVIDKTYLSMHQIELIKSHAQHAKENLCIDTWDWDWECPWEIEESPGMIRGDTSMNNFDMYRFLEAIGINIDNVRWN